MMQEKWRVDVYIVDNFYIIFHDNKRGKCYLLEIGYFIDLLMGHHKIPVLEGKVERIIEEGYSLGCKFTFVICSDYDSLIITANTDTKEAAMEYSGDGIRDEVTEVSMLRIRTDLEVDPEALEIYKYF